MSGLLVFLSLGVSFGATVSQTQTGPAIPDSNSTGVNVDFVFGPSGTIATGNNVTFSLTNFSHTWAGDLIATITHVDTGTVATVMNRPGGGTFGSSANFDAANTYNFNDGFAAAIQTVPSNPTVIPSTDFFPATPFSVFNGEAVGGTWRLRVSDNAAGDTSNANWNATLTFVTADAVGTPEPSTLLTVGLAGGALLVGLVRRRMHR